LEDDKTYPIVTRRSGHGKKKEIEDFVKKQAQFMEIEETKSGETRGLNNKFQQNRMEERPKNGKKDEVSDIKKIVDLKKVMEGKKGEAKMVQGGPVEPKKTQIDQKRGIDLKKVQSDPKKPQIDLKRVAETKKVISEPKKGNQPIAQVETKKKLLLFLIPKKRNRKKYKQTSKNNNYN